MKKLIILFGLIVLCFNAIGQLSTEATMRNAGDSIPKVLYNMYFYGIYDNNTEAVVRPYGTFSTIASPIFTGEIGIGSVNVNETELGILEGATVVTSELNVLDGIPVGLTSTEIGYSDGVTSPIQDQFGAKVDTSDVFLYDTTVYMLTDTTIALSFQIDSSAINTTTLYTLGADLFYFSDSLVVDAMSVLAHGSTVNFTVDVMWNTTEAVSGATHLNTVAITVTTGSGGRTVDLTFDNGIIDLPGKVPFVMFPDLTSPPDKVTVTVFCHRQNRTY